MLSSACSEVRIELPQGISNAPAMRAYYLRPHLARRKREEMSRQQLPPQIKKVDVTDRKTGKRVMRYQLTVDAGKSADGRRRQVRRRYASEREARKALAGITGGVVDGTFVARSALTIEQACRDWLAGMHDIEPTTRAAYTHALKPLRDRHGGMPARQLTKAHLDQLVTDLTAGAFPGHKSPWTANSINRC